jgi:hypothetical protein
VRVGGPGVAATAQDVQGGQSGSQGLREVGVGVAWQGDVLQEGERFLRCCQLLLADGAVEAEVGG